MADTSSPVYISVILPQETEDLIRKAMAEYDVTWPDLVLIDNPDYHQWPFQVRYVFRRRANRGDDNYADWEAGDTFIHDDDPKGVEHKATWVDHEYDTVTFKTRVEGEFVAPFSAIRRVKRGARQ